MSSRLKQDGATIEIDMLDVAIPPYDLGGTLRVPSDAKALVVFVHGSGSSRFSPRNMAVAHALDRQGIATLLFDLLTSKEESDRKNVFDIPLLAERLVQTVNWIDQQPRLSKLPLGFFSASTGAAAALVAASKLGARVGAIVSRGGRPDLAGCALKKIETPALLIVGGTDLPVIDLNERAMLLLKGPKALRIILGATHLFPEQGALKAVIANAVQWFDTYLIRRGVEASKECLKVSAVSIPVGKS